MAILSDEFYYQSIRIDTVNTRVYADIVAKEGDANGRGLLLTLTENGLMKDTTGIALNLKWEHTSVGNQGLDNFEAVDLSKGLYKITYPTEMLNRGKVRAFIQIIDSGKLAGTRNIEITVDRGVGDDTAIASSDSFTALAQALIDVNNLESTYAPELLSVKQQLAEAATKDELTQVASPLVATLAAQMTDITRVYVYTGAEGGYTAGNWYYHNGTVWVSGGMYQSSGIGNGSVTKLKLADNGVSIEKTDFLSRGKNLFDKDKYTSGYYVNQTTGALDANVNYVATDFIAIEAIPVTQSRSYHTAFYDSNQVFISGLAPSASPADPRTFTPPVNAKYMRCTCLISQRGALQIEYGSVATEYEDFGYRFNKAYQGSKPLINLPPTVFGVVGKEINIYYRNIIENPEAYNIEVAGSIGKQQAERWTCIPAEAVTTPIVISLYDKLTGSLVTTASTSVVVKDTTVGSGVNKKCMFIGDSTTAAGKYTQELLTLFGADTMDITLLGTRGTAPNLHEGRSGWTTDMYCNTASFGGVVNPFYNGGFDFNYYITNNPTVPDVVAIHLGINDIFNDTTDAANDTTITDVLSRFDTMVNSIQAYSAAIKVALMVTIPPSASQDAFGDDYANNQSLWRYRRNYFRFVKAFIAKYKGKEANNIYLVPLNTNLDTVNNMQTETVAVNSRNTATVVRQNNGVHPADSGYNQMADVNYYWLKSFEM